MISTPVTLNNALTEVGESSGTQKEIGTLMNKLNQYTTGATHSADSSANLVGFTGGTVWHFLNVSSAYDPQNGYIRVTVNNYGIVDAQSGTLDWYMHDNIGNYAGSGSQSVSSLAANSSTYYDFPWATYHPTKFYWRWSNSLSYNLTNIV